MASNMYLLAVLLAVLCRSSISEGWTGWTSQLDSNAEEAQLQHQLNITAGVKFFIFNRDWPAGVQVQVDWSVASLQAQGYNSSLPTIFIIHGYGHNIHGDVFKRVAKALLDTDTPANVMGVDWGALCRKPLYTYPFARSRVGPVGRRVADFVRFLVDAGLARRPDVHLIGHSLGAHVAGNVGKQIKVGRITGLDPAGPLFFTRSSDRLTSGDADLVDVIHTCVGIKGFKDPVGHVDFYPNGGRVFQPGCGFRSDGLELGKCSHARAFELYAESILNELAFPATLCHSFEEALHKKCEGHGPSDPVAYMGHHLQFTEPGAYFLRTRGTPPYWF